MITLENNTLTLYFPEIHPEAKLQIDFQRTLRVPDDGKEYPLPAGLGRFDLRHIEDFGEALSESWLRRGGVLMPMYQSEAMWINFSGAYPMAIKIAAGKINAVTGEPWQNDLSNDPQDYVVTPRQPWLDGFCTGHDQVRQFVASRLGEGETAEEQLTDAGEFGGLQLIVYPLRGDIYEQEQEHLRNECREFDLDLPMFCRRATPDQMGLGLGGTIRQHIYQDDRGLDAWDINQSARCFVHLLNSEQWQDITDSPPPHVPVKAEAYRSAGVPWFDYYDDHPALPASGILQKLKSFASFHARGARSDDQVSVTNVIQLGKKRHVSDGDF